MEPLLDTNAASEVLTELGDPHKPATLRKKRCTGGGPKFRRLGSKPVYTRSDLEAWIEERLSEAFGSNSEAEERLRRRSADAGSGPTPPPWIDPCQQDTTAPFSCDEPVEALEPRAE